MKITVLSIAALTLLVLLSRTNGQCASGSLACGSQCYLPDLFSCFDGFLCPSGHMRCGTSCYLPSIYSCEGDTLIPRGSPTPPPPSTCNCPTGLSCCGAACYSTSVHTCYGTVLCPVGTHLCGNACYSKSEFSCCDGVLCPPESTQPPPPPPPGPNPPPPPPSSDNDYSSTPMPPLPPGWTSVFEDEFSGTAIDRSKWGVLVGDGCPEDCTVRDGFTNDYTEDSVSVVNGIMRLTATRIPGTDRWHSGRISTYNTFPFRYGRVDFRARIETGDGPFAGLNIMARNNVYGEWPLSGEINMLKYNAAWKQNGITRTSHAFHFAQFIENRFQNPDVDKFREYSLVWDEDVLILYAGSLELLRYHKPQGSGYWQWPFDQLFYLYITLNIDWNQGPKVPPHVNRYVLEVDWIRISQRH